MKLPEMGERCPGDGGEQERDDEYEDFERVSEKRSAVAKGHADHKDEKDEE